ncbi:sigma-70 family RNA polymerase sigma factor [Methylomonas sp. UP202]|uniref:RNA polymerase sigma factor n=1 Tax=Methylomonas sp. UP202 TaxID=3040943 RepID=UPI00247890D4|nr:sigma-70 family RNA polymerase sigma factor [Methylomonas sp. UP202]WGS88398.1 sigma-70 family RNA polymerase sigma factor [Methylomonas sp. UP202]
MTIKSLFEQLFHSHSKELVYFAGQRAAEVAEDVVQESFLRLMQHPEPQTIENHRAYLYKLTGNALIDYQRKLAVRERYHGEVEDLDSLPADAPGPDVSLHHQQILQGVMRALDELPPLQRSIFLLHRVDGLTYLQIGKLLRMSRSNVERQFYAALEHCFAAALAGKR